MNALAQVFPPGEFLKEELEARGWSQTELAEIMGRPVRLINEIVAGKKSITPETAVQLGEALETSAQLWLNLETQWQLSRVERPDPALARRARLHKDYPVREMAKRGWIDNPKDIEQLETVVKTYFGLDKLGDEITFHHAAKKTPCDEKPTTLQYAWLFRARTIAREMKVQAFSAQALDNVLARLPTLRASANDVANVAPWLAECGVRFVVIEAIPGTKIDGACFWLKDDQPVVAMSLRFDRIDNFWFVLRHELEHVRLGHGKATGFIIDDLESGSTPQENPEEIVANAAAAEFCAPQEPLKRFLVQVRNHVSAEHVMKLAHQFQVHPGLVVGQLHRQLGRHDLFKKHQVKVRGLVTSTACTDGHGTTH